MFGSCPDCTCPWRRQMFSALWRGQIEVSKLPCRGHSCLVWLYSRFGRSHQNRRPTRFVKDYLSWRGWGRSGVNENEECIYPNFNLICLIIHNLSRFKVMSTSIWFKHHKEVPCKWRRNTGETSISFTVHVKKEWIHVVLKGQFFFVNQCTAIGSCNVLFEF